MQSRDKNDTDERNTLLKYPKVFFTEEKLIRIKARFVKKVCKLVGNIFTSVAYKIFELNREFISFPNINERNKEKVQYFFLFSEKEIDKYISVSVILLFQ